VRSDSPVLTVFGGTGQLLASPTSAVTSRPLIRSAVTSRKADTLRLAASAGSALLKPARDAFQHLE